MCKLIGSYKIIVNYFAPLLANKSTLTPSSVMNNSAQTIRVGG